MNTSKLYYCGDNWSFNKSWEIIDAVYLQPVVRDVWFH